MSQIDNQKQVYLFVHGRTDLESAAINALVSNGFSKDKIICKTRQSWEYRQLHGHALDATKSRSHQDSENYKSKQALKA